MTLEGFGKFLAETLPRLRTRIQLAGFVVAIAAGITIQLASPGNIKAIISAGSIGISIVIFGQIFQYLVVFSQKDRPKVFLGAFAVLVLLLFIIAAMTLKLSEEPRAVLTLYEGDLPADLERVDLDQEDLAEELRDQLKESKQEFGKFLKGYRIQRTISYFRSSSNDQGNMT